MITFFKDSYFELMNKVTWPKYPKLLKEAVLILVASLIFALLIGGVDYIFKLGLKAFYESIG